MERNSCPIPTMRLVCSLGIFLLLHNAILFKSRGVSGLYVNIIPRHFLQYLQLVQESDHSTKEEDDNIREVHDDENDFPRGINWWLPHDKKSDVSTRLERRKRLWWEEAAGDSATNIN